MSDFTDAFWSLWVGGLTLLSILGCALLLMLYGGRRIPGEPVGTTGHEWDGDLAELNHPLPKWWSGLFWITILFSLAYLLLYPGLGSFAGLFGWSSSGQYQEERLQAERQYEPIFRGFAALEIEAIAKDPKARAMGERLFLNYCAQCHGSDARGAKGFPDLTDADWLYGDDPKQILVSILEGRKGVMPAMEGALGGPEGAADMAHYVLSLSGAKHDAARAGRAMPKFAVCAACHGAEGRGNPQIGAPNLADKTWLYGASLEALTESIARGREGVMPAHREFLGEERSRILAGYVVGLSRR